MIWFTTKNCENETVQNIFDNVSEIKTNWFSEDGTTLPAGDDELCSAYIDGVKLYLPNSDGYDYPIFLDLLIILGIDKRI